MIERLDHPLVHGTWTAAWWEGDAHLAALFGPHPSDQALAATADRIGTGTDSRWRASLHRATEHPVPGDALVVLAGQQPVLLGGPLLVAHKAATAIAVARRLERSLERPVVPVFLLATQDHDSSEVDHLDVINHVTGQLLRIRVDIHPEHEMFWRSSWDETAFSRAVAVLKEQDGYLDSVLGRLDALQGDAATVPWHVADLLHDAFGELGLRILPAHRLEASGRTLLDRALRERATLADELRAGAARLGEAGLPVPFDPADSRPLVLESPAGRRRRLQARDEGAVERLAAHPEDFSPHAALRPLVQAAALPVVAQVCGPSEILYLGQARGLHGWAGLTPPVLVPRLEATRVAPGQHDAARALLDRTAPDERRPAKAEAELREAARRFSDAVRARDPDLQPRLRRFLRQIDKGARRLAEAPAWRGHGGPPLEQDLRPRGRYQDTTLAWLPEAWRAGRPGRWARHVIDLAEPLLPPVHVLHSPPREFLDG